MSPASSAVTTATGDHNECLIGTCWSDAVRVEVGRIRENLMILHMSIVLEIATAPRDPPALVIDGRFFDAPGISIDRRSQSFLGIVGVPVLSSAPQTFPGCIRASRCRMG